MKRTLFAFTKYCSVATGAMLTDWVVFLILNVLGVKYIYAQMVARIAGGLFSFAVNRGWSFEAWQDGHLTRHGRRFLLLYAFSYVLSISLLYLLVEQVGMVKYVAKLVADGTCFLLNFVVMRTYVFKDRAGFTAAFGRILTWLDKRLRPEDEATQDPPPRERTSVLPRN